MKGFGDIPGTPLLRPSVRIEIDVCTVPAGPEAGKAAVVAIPGGCEVSGVWVSHCAFEDEQTLKPRPIRITETREDFTVNGICGLLHPPRVQEALAAKEKAETKEHVGRWLRDGFKPEAIDRDAGVFARIVRIREAEVKGCAV